MQLIPDLCICWPQLQGKIQGNDFHHIYHCKAYNQRSTYTCRKQKFVHEKGSN